MTALLTGETMTGLTLEFPDSIDLSGDRFFDFCIANRDLRIERTAEGEIIIMPPADTETGRRNAELTRQIANWTKQDGRGIAYDSSTGFELPNGATRSPDGSWVLRAKVKSAKSAKPRKKGFLKLCPDFVVELRSPSDRLSTVKAKMEEYIENGAQLGWLIDPQTKKAYIYRPNAPVEERPNAKTIIGDPPLRGFKLDLEPIWAEEP